MACGTLSGVRHVTRRLTVELDDDTAREIDRAVERGRFPSAQALITAALDAWNRNEESRTSRLAEIEAEILEAARDTSPDFTVAEARARLTTDDWKIGHGPEHADL